MVFLLMRTFFLFYDFFFNLCGFFCALVFYILFFTKVLQKQDTTQEYQKNYCLSVSDFLL
jgi:hypothetical protein